MSESVCHLRVTTLGTAEANTEEKPKNLKWLPPESENQGVGEGDGVDQKTVVFYYKPLSSCWAF